MTMYGASHPTAPKILVVCHANQARSPLAAALLAFEAEQYGLDVPKRFPSAGTDAQPGDLALPSMIKAAGKLGLDLSSHRTRPLTPTMVARSDMIVTMTEEQRARVSRMAAQALTRTFTLRELVRLGEALDEISSPLSQRATELHRLRSRVVGATVPEDVEDPSGRDGHATDKIAREIRRLVGRAAPPLFAEP
jgi:protein-tyrosine phosphatase